MAKSGKKLSTDELGILLLIAAILFGTWFRLYTVSTAGFPINDGGLFYKMIQAVQANHYRLPEYVQYNGLKIPFAYPPLVFYLNSIMADVAGIDPLSLLLWMPAITLIAIIPVVYYLASLLLQSRLQAGLAALLYALLPSAMAWTIMGGGITRSAGQLFHLLTLTSVYLLFTRRRNKYLVLSVLFGSLVCITHPEAALHTAGISILFLLFFGRDRYGITRALLVAGGIFLVTSPWWITMLERYGLDPYLSIARTGLHGFSYAVALFTPLSGEPFLTIIAILAVLGVAVKIAKKDYLLPIWFVFPFFLEPRSAVNFCIFPMVLLASVALTELIFPALAGMEASARNRKFETFLQSRTEKILFFYLLGCLLIGMQYYALNHSSNHISPGVMEGFEWVRNSTPAGSKFIILTGKTDVFADYTNEWFPIFADRQSLTTVQGHEWLDGNGFSDRVRTIQHLQQCSSDPSPLLCAAKKADEAGLEYDYIMTSSDMFMPSWNDSLTLGIQSPPSYEFVYRNDQVSIFRHLK
jgi:hypothetical protein